MPPLQQFSGSLKGTPRTTLKTHATLSQVEPRPRLGIPCPGHRPVLSSPWRRASGGSDDQPKADSPGPEPESGTGVPGSQSRLPVTPCGALAHLLAFSASSPYPMLSQAFWGTRGAEVQSLLSRVPSAGDRRPRLTSGQSRFCPEPGTVAQTAFPALNVISHLHPPGPLHPHPARELIPDTLARSPLVPGPRLDPEALGGRGGLTA